MSLKPNLKIVSMILFSTLLLFNNCKESPGHDKRAYILKAKLKLSEEQAKKIKSVFLESNKQTDIDRRQYKGNNESLLKAAKARKAKELSMVESILNEIQKAKYKEMMAGKDVSDRTLLLGEQLGLNYSVTARIEKIVTNAPTKAEIADAKKTGDPEKLKVLNQRMDKFHEKMELFLNEEQKAVFKKMIQKKWQI